MKNEISVKHSNSKNGTCCSACTAHISYSDKEPIKFHKVVAVNISSIRFGLCYACLKSLTEQLIKAKQEWIE